MNVSKCACGRKPFQEPVQAFNVIRCDECDIEASDLDYHKAVRAWNNKILAIQPLDYEVMQ